MKQRKLLARIDDEIKQGKVAEARDHIYRRNYAVDNDGVETLLKYESLVPTDVCLVSLTISMALRWQVLECFLETTRTFWLQHLSCTRCRLYARIWTWSVESSIYSSDSHSRSVRQVISYGNGSSVSSVFGIVGVCRYWSWPYPQLQVGAELWPRYDSKILFQHFRAEKTRGTWLWRHFAGLSHSLQCFPDIPKS